MASADAAPALLRVRVALDLGPHRVECVDLELAPGTSVAASIASSGLRERHPGVDFESLSVSVWGRPRGGSHRVRDRDRIELLRPLQVDPMEARRRRQAGQRGPQRVRPTAP